MKKLLVHLPDELRKDLKELSRRRKRSVSKLVQRAIEKTYMDELDGILVDREVAAYLADPSSSVTLEEYLARRNAAQSTKEHDQ